MAGGPLAEGPLKELVSSQDDGSSVSFQEKLIGLQAVGTFLEWRRAFSMFEATI